MSGLKVAFLVALCIIDLKAGNCLGIAQLLIESNPDPEDLDDIFREADIVPTYIPYSPAELLHVKFMEAAVNYGNNINVLDTLVKPQVWWNDTDEDAEPDSLYTLMFVNLDLGDPCYLHWMVTNIHHGDLHNATVTMKYKFPDPPLNEEDEPYKMLFLVYRQPDLQPYPYDAQFFLGRTEDRSVFSIEDFVSSYNFTEFPVAGNFFNQPTRLSTWYPLNPPHWMEPFIPYIKEHEHGVWELPGHERHPPPPNY